VGDATLGWVEGRQTGIENNFSTTALDDWEHLNREPSLV